MFENARGLMLWQGGSCRYVNGNPTAAKSWQDRRRWWNYQGSERPGGTREIRRSSIRSIFNSKLCWSESKGSARC